MKLFSTIRGKFLFLIFVSIISVLSIGFWILAVTVERTVKEGLWKEMRGILVQGESVTNFMSELGKAGAFDVEHRLKENLNAIGADNYRNTLIYKTVPVVAAWNAIREAIKETNIQFRIIRENARNEENRPRSEFELKILRRLEGSEEKEFFEVNREVGLIAYARPVILTESCMSCHGDPSLSPSGDGRDILGFKMEGWKPGERKGVYLLTAPVSNIDTPTREGILASLMWILPIGVGIILVALFVANKISFRLNETIWLLAESSKQLTDSSVQIAQSSSTIAEGASEQASSLEQTSASLEEIASMTKRNAENAQSAREVSRQAWEAAEMGAMSVVEMNRAMADIQAASDNISKIIKTIDEIAFQTNILALNAAVEAARAGEAGMGFAVVADEVRALAQRSAEAARETAERIEDSVRKASSGVTISDKVAKNLDEIVQKIRVVDEFVAEIAAASREQSQGIEQVNVAVNEMDKVVQKNASYSEEFSAAAENLKQQAALLKDTILRLRQLATGS